MYKWNKVLLVIMAVYFILTPAQPLHAKKPTANRQVLIVNSYHSGLSWTDSVMDGIRETFAVSGYDIQLSAEYLDARRYVDPDRARKIRELVILKLKGTAPSLIMASDNAALEFLLQNRDLLFQNTPIVFCGINNFNSTMISKYHGITGVAEDVSIIETVDLALRFHPKTRKVIVIGRTTVAADKANRDSFVAALPTLPPRIKVTFWDDIPIPELKARIGKLQDDAILFLNGLITDETGRQLMYGETTKWISRQSPVPVYSLWDVYLGYGIMGGKLVSGYRQGQIASKLALRILGGEKPESIPVINAPEANRYMFDYNQLVKFRIPLSILPKDAVIINHPDTFYHKYKGYIWATAAVVFALSCFVIVLSIAIIRRRRAEEALRQANLVVENSSVVLFRWKADQGWPIVLVSRNVIQFGYTPEELLSGSINYASFIHPHDLVRVASEVQDYTARGIDHFRQEYRILTKDGEIRWVHDRTMAERDILGRITHFQGIVIDISERKRVEEILHTKTEELNRIFSLSLDLLCTANVDGRLIRVNPAWEQVLGYRQDELEGQNFFDFIHPDDVPATLDAAAELAAGKDVIDFSNRYRCSDGSYRWIEWRSKSYQETLIYAAARDVTGRRRAEEAMRESEEKHRAILENIEESYFELDLKGNYTFFNESLCTHQGYSRQELMGMNFKAYTSSETARKAYKAFNEIYRTGRPLYIADYEIIRKDGSKRNIEMSISLMRNPSGEPIGFRGVGRDVTDRIQSEQAIRESERIYRMITENVREVIWIMDFNMKYPYMSPSIVRLTGYTPEDLHALPIQEQLTPESYALVEKRLAEELALEKSGEPLDPGRLMILELELKRKEGGTVWVEVTASFNRDKDGRAIGILGVSKDITDRRRAEEERSKLEAQLIQAQKMESIGRLAGGVAHDFNNMLNVISGYAELIKLRLNDNDGILQDILEIEKAANRSRDITTQLLAFSRKQIISPRSMDLNMLILSMQKTLARLIGEDIDLQFYPGDNLWKVKVDPSQVEQILLNLGVNARDAMPGGGKLTIETTNIRIDENYCRTHLGFTPGLYVLLSMSDNGSGMDKETLQNIFEPFFTTKEIGKGTGLGLATVYGIIQQNCGLINVYSEPGHGTTFRIYLPRCLDGVDKPDETIEFTVSSGSGRVVLVEDEDLVRKMTKDMLEAIGYTVQTTQSPLEALSMCEEMDSQPDLVITDVVMPSMSGRELRDKLKTIWPDIKVLFMSGYTANVIVHHGVLEEGVHFLQKPFSMNDLAGKVREAMGKK